MIISLLVAMDQGRGIGKDNRLPWRLSADLKRFKALTMGHTLITGRKTFESIGRALQGRKMIIVTRNPSYSIDGASPISDTQPGELVVAHSLLGALQIAKAGGEDETFVIGGGEIFSQALPLASRIYLTSVKAKLECDTFFPQLDLSEWEMLEERAVPADERNDYDSLYQVLARKPVNENLSSKSQ